MFGSVLPRDRIDSTGEKQELNLASLPLSLCLRNRKYQFIAICTENCSPLQGWRLSASHGLGCYGCRRCCRRRAPAEGPVVQQGSCGTGLTAGADGCSRCW